MTSHDQLFRRTLVWDMTLPYAQVVLTDGTLERFREVGIDVISVTVGSDPYHGPDRTTQLIGAYHAYCRRNPSFVIVRSAADIEAAHAAGRTALTFNLQGTNPLSGNVDLIRVYYELGVRYMLLAYNQMNSVGDGCAEPTDAGLSRFGRTVIAEMNRVGMLVDGSHSGYRTTMEAMEVTTAPFIFSHSNAHAVFPHYRNIRDDQIKACAATGGVIGLNGLGGFLDDPEAGSQSLFRHLDHVAQLVGAAHVGLGLDYVRDYEGFWAYVRAHPDAWPLNNGRPHPVAKFVQPEQLLDLTELMLGHGYAESDVEGVLGGNFLRLAREVWT